MFRTVLPKNQYNIFEHFSTKRDFAREFNAENAMRTAAVSFFKHFILKVSLI